MKTDPSAAALCALTVDSNAEAPSPIRPGVCPIGGAVPWLRDPKIKGGSKCRGSCGIDCRHCKKADDVMLQIPASNPGFQRLCLYKKVVRCGTHAACRFHDNCWDCAKAKGETKFFGPMHTACNRKASSTVGLRKSLSLLASTGPFDGYMNFSEAPEISPAFLLPALRLREPLNGGVVPK